MSCLQPVVTWSDGSAAEEWNKSEYPAAHRCGADQACIVSEQETQMRRYREGYRAAHPLARKIFDIPFFVGSVQQVAGHVA